MTLKSNLRQRLRAALHDLPEEDVQSRSSVACDRLANQPEYQRSEIIMVFLSLPHEVNTTQLVLKAWQDGKRVLAPRVSWEQRRMMPIEIRSLTENIEETQWNIRQPSEGTPIPIGMIDLVLVPGIGFDAAGNRLGRGKGFYDRFLAHPQFHGIICGLAFEQQLVEDIPPDPHDIPVHMLVTEQTCQRFDHVGVQ